MLGESKITTQISIHVSRVRVIKLIESETESETVCYRDVPTATYTAHSSHTSPSSQRMRNQRSIEKAATRALEILLLTAHQAIRHSLLESVI
jgi:hypothetical protein